MKHNIYADNAATTKLDKDAFEAMLPWLQEDFGNASQPYSFARRPKKALSDARALIASCIGAEPNEIYFTSGGTESDNWAIKSMATMGGSIITSQIEHHAVLHACACMERFGANVIRLPVNSGGIVLPETLATAITEDASIVSVMMANNEIGTIQPIKDLVQIAHHNGVVFHTDAVQAVGHIPIDVNELGVDMLSASAHKFNGPKGVGFLYIRNGTPIHPYMDGGAQERGMRAGTENISGIVGMAIALKKNCSEMFETADKLRNMENCLIDALRTGGVDFVRNGSDNRLPGNVNISIKGANGEMLLHRLDLQGIAVSTGSACDSVNAKISHVIEAIGVPAEYANGTIRISFGNANMEEDAETIAAAIIRILRKTSDSFFTHES